MNALPIYNFPKLYLYYGKRSVCNLFNFLEEIVWVGPLSQHFGDRHTGLDYWDSCTLHNDATDTTVEKCKAICESGSECNAFVFNSDMKTCKLKNCPHPFPKPGRNFNSDQKKLYYIRNDGKIFRYFNQLYSIENHFYIIDYMICARWYRTRIEDCLFFRYLWSKSLFKWWHLYIRK